MFDLLGTLLDGERQRIQFATGGTPYDVVHHLEQHGVTCWPTGDISVDADGVATATVLVNPGQHRYAAGLIAGMAGIALLSPAGVRPIRPRSDWGRPNRGARGPIASILRLLA